MPGIEACSVPVLAFSPRLKRWHYGSVLASFPVRMHLVFVVLPYLTVIKRAASLFAIFGL